MRAYNSRKTPREHYLFMKKGRNLSLTKAIEYENYFGEKIKEIYSHTFKLFREDKKLYIVCSLYTKIEYSGELAKLIKKSKGTSITETINVFKRLVEFYKYNIDVSKIERKYFVSRDIFQVEKLLKEKGILKEKGVEN